MKDPQLSNDVHLRYFLAIAQDLSLTRTAERLNLSQPALSQHLRHLEETLGQRLMERNGRGLRLTKPGEELARSLRGVFHYIDISMERARDSLGKVTGTLAVAVVHPLNSYFMPTVVSEFCKDYPDVEFTIYGRTCTEIVKLVRDGGAALGLVYGTHVTVEDMAMLHLFNETMVVGCTPNLEGVNQLREQGTLPDKMPMVLSPRGHSVRLTMDRAFPPGKLVVKAEVETLDAMMALAGSGIGACVVPAGIAPAYFRVYGLERFELAKPQLMREASVIFRKDVEQPVLVNAFTQKLRSLAKRFAHESACTNGEVAAAPVAKISPIQRNRKIANGQSRRY